MSNVRIAIISDIHANLPALEAVLERAKGLGAETIWCLGDTVGYGPFPSECVSLVRERCAVVLQGNHDSGLIGETSIEDFNRDGLKAIEWSREVVPPEQMEYLRSLPLTANVEGVTLAHASPHRPGAWHYVLTLPSARDAFKAFATTFCFIGHTHVPVIIGEDGSVNRLEAGKRFLINVGSVGQPRDGNPDAAFGLLDTSSGSYELIRVPYDIEKTSSAIAKAGLPRFLAGRLFQGI
jgi:diadenosine tetraphosphatase ApaH/serine/threonine PP2A family protein phosphatase